MKKIFSKEEKNKISKHTKEQSITITNSKIFDFLEVFSVFLHIVAFVLGIVTLTGIIILGENAETAQHDIEIITIVIVGLIIFLYFIDPLIKKIAIKNALNSFWGTNKVNTIIIAPKNVVFKPSELGQYGYIKDKTESHQTEKITVGWVKSKYKMKTTLGFVMEIPITKETKKWSERTDNNETINYMMPKHILLDLKTRVLMMSAILINDSVSGEYDDTVIEVKFNLKKLNMKWTGSFPEHPFYGEWEWVPKSSLDKFKHRKNVEKDQENRTLFKGNEIKKHWWNLKK